MRLGAIASIVVAALGLTASTGAFAAEDGVAIVWTRDPDLVPWETMTTSGDPDRTPARTRADLQRRRSRVHAFLDDTTRSQAEHAAALAELGDLFRDEARLVLQDDANDPWRIPLQTSPAWLQLEFALRWYGEAVEKDAGAVNQDGRLTLLRAVIASRLGQDESFDDYVQVIRSYRGTPYVEMAKLAVGDHHFRHGDLERASKAYRMVRGNREPELSAYADYRMASIHAARGEPERALPLLVALVESDRPGPMFAMLRDAARSAMSNHLAADRGLVEMIPWIAEACPPEDRACDRDLRSAASDTYARLGEDRADAWLRTVDALEPIRGQVATRVDLARSMLSEAPPMEVLLAAEGVCAATDDPCRAEAAHAVATFYDEIGDPGGAWLQSYVRLPRMNGRPDVHALTARIAREARPPSQELAEAEALCDGADRACQALLRTHLRAVWGRLSRLHDAAWLGFVDTPPPIPGPPDAELTMKRLVRDRADARKALEELAPGCGTDADCRDELFELLVGYYAATGMENEANWLIALKMLPELPLPTPRREALRQAALAGDDATTTMRALLETCETLTPNCFETSRVGAEAFLRTAARHAEAVVIRDLGALSRHAVPAAVFPVLVDIALTDTRAPEALARVEAACAGGVPDCGADARAVLTDWFEERGLHLDARQTRQVDAAPDLGPYSRLTPAFLRVARTSPDPVEAAGRVQGLCPATAAACPGILKQALADWYEARGQVQDARKVMETP